MVEFDTRAASEELRTAAVYQRRAGRRAACLMIVLTIVTAVVLLAVSSLTILPNLELILRCSQFALDRVWFFAVLRL